jgi:hypothetical protein
VAHWSSRRCAAAIAVLTCAALLLSACGGGGGDEGAAAEFDPGPVEIAKPGSTRALGERAFVRYAGLGAKNEPTVDATLGVTVQQVDEGSSSDIDGLGESSVPHYVHVEYENHGGASIMAFGPGGRFTIRGSDGEEYDTEGVISIGGEFEKCPDAEPQATLAPEEAIADCVVITLKEGVSPQEVRFQADYAANQKPVGWTL